MKPASINKPRRLTFFSLQGCLYLAWWIEYCWCRDRGRRRSSYSVPHRPGSTIHQKRWPGNDWPELESRPWKSHPKMSACGYLKHRLCAHIRSRQNNGCLVEFHPRKFLKGSWEHLLEEEGDGRLYTVFIEKHQAKLPNKISIYEGFWSTSKNSYLIHMKLSLRVPEEILASQSHHGFFGSTQSELFINSVVQPFLF